MALKIVDYFDKLVALGLQIIPLRANSKIPYYRKWNAKQWNMEKAREQLLRYPDSNIGLLLGQIIDVEGDDEHANRLIEDLIGDYPHPVYTSTKSVHHLFRTPDPDLSIQTFEKVEFRGYGHQSVLPPSVHYGISYRWVNARFPVPEMPPRLLRFFEKLRRGLKDDVKPGHVKVYCSVCGKEHYLHKRRWKLELQAFSTFGLQWQCHVCRKLDLRPLCRKLKRHPLESKAQTR